MHRRFHAAALAAIIGAAPLVAQGSRGTLVVLNKAAATASLIDVASGETRATLPTGEGPHEVAASADGRWAVVTNYGTAQAPGGTLTVLDLRAPAVVRTISVAPYSRPHGVTWLDDGRRVAVTAEADSAVLLVDVRRGAVERALRTGQGTTHMVTAAPNGRALFAGNIGSGSVTRLDLASGEARSVATGAGSEGITTTPDGREVWVANRGANTVSVLDAATLEVRATIPSAEFPIRVRITPDGRTALVSNARSSELRLFDVRTHAPVGTVSMAFDSAKAKGTMLGATFGASAVPIGIVIAPDSRTAFVANANIDAVTVVDIARREIVGYLKTGREPDGMAWVKRN